MDIFAHVFANLLFPDLTSDLVVHSSNSLPGVNEVMQPNLFTFAGLGGGVNSATLGKLFDACRPCIPNGTRCNKFYFAH